MTAGIAADGGGATTELVVVDTDSATAAVDATDVVASATAESFAIAGAIAAGAIATFRLPIGTAFGTALVRAGRAAAAGAAGKLLTGAGGGLGCWCWSPGGANVVLAHQIANGADPGECQHPFEGRAPIDTATQAFREVVEPAIVHEPSLCDALV